MQCKMTSHHIEGVTGSLLWQQLFGTRSSWGHTREHSSRQDQGLPFTKGPLVFETTGAMGEEKQKWWKSIVEMEADQRIPGTPQSRREQGLEHTWSANKFSSYWL